LEQRKLVTRPVAFSWLDYLAGRAENDARRRLVRSPRNGERERVRERERSLAKAVFDFARLNGLVKSDLTGYLTERGTRNVGRDAQQPCKPCKPYKPIVQRDAARRGARDPESKPRFAATRRRREITLGSRGGRFLGERPLSVPFRDRRGMTGEFPRDE
jgi:hypothetical protein